MGVPEDHSTSSKTHTTGSGGSVFANENCPGGAEAAVRHEDGVNISPSMMSSSRTCPAGQGAKGKKTCMPGSARRRGPGFLS